MATHTLLTLTDVATPYVGYPSLANYYSGFPEVSLNGDSDSGVCLRVSGDSKDVTCAPPAGFVPIVAYFADDAVIPIGATINSVTFNCRIKGTDASFDNISTGVAIFTRNSGGGPFIPLTSTALGASYSNFTTGPLTVNPFNSTAWLRSDLFSDGNAGNLGNGAWAFILSFDAPGATMGADFFSLVVDYTAPGGPAIVSIDVDEGPVTGDTDITVTGTDLDVCTNPEIFIGGSWLPATFINSTTLQVTTPEYFNVDLTDPTLDVILRCGGTPVSTLTDAFTWTPVWWDFDPPVDMDVEASVLAYGPPDPSTLPTPPDFETWDDALVAFPTFKWWDVGVAPDPDGWYYSPSNFGGDVFVTDSDNRPVNPRKWSQFTRFATGATNMLGGSPAAAAVKNNRLYYAAANYTSGTTSPAIRIMNRGSDYQLGVVPKTDSGAVPYSIVSMLAANGTIYVSTLDSGTTSADWVGRVFEFDTNSGQMTRIGAAFPTGHVPYSLAFHNGRLWCGTHKQTAAGAGRVYFFRPGIDTDWTLDKTLASGNVTSLLGFKGQLYAGTSNANGTLAILLKRDTLGVWTTSNTGVAASPKDGNGFLALHEFNDTLYSSYWNNDTTPDSYIAKSTDGVTWAGSYVGSSGTNRPYIGLTSDNSFLFAIAGGIGRTAALVRTADGITWTNLTGFLPETTETFVPVFGVLIR